MTINQIQRLNPQINHTNLCNAMTTYQNTKTEKTTKKNLLLVVFFNFHQQKNQA